MEEERPQNINPSTLASRRNKSNKWNTETAHKNQQSSIQGLETQIGQVAKLISERPQGVVTLEPEPRQETETSKGKGGVDHNKQKPFIEALSQMPNAMKVLNKLLANKRKLNEASHVKLNAEMSLIEVHESFSSNSRGPIHEERRLQIEELDKWRTHKPRTRDKPKLRQNKLNTFSNQLKPGLAPRVAAPTLPPRNAETSPTAAVRHREQHGRPPAPPPGAQPRKRTPKQPREPNRDKQKARTATGVLRANADHRPHRPYLNRLNRTPARPHSPPTATLTQPLKPTTPPTANYRLPLPSRPPDPRSNRRPPDPQDTPTPSSSTPEPAPARSQTHARTRRHDGRAHPQLHLTPVHGPH
ncbi:hypothetical protein GOBAR_AA29397 [Gossypium barbadense]|uniref:Uncharacterized protein n=1 Tax=Gossypium barbadense TaxID=3634 RepID=A0A2P5WJM2_GOSBA|nr:hypothetical protein GOBAR_AA29397 [Gossypium barbadense]